MRHKKVNRKLSRKSGQRRALLRSLARSLILMERITTTEAKAKELRPFLERLIAINKETKLSSYRNTVSQVGNLAAKKVKGSLSDRYKDRNGGYLRIVKSGLRPKDAARTVVVELV